MKMKTPEEIKLGLEAIAETDIAARAEKVARLVGVYRYFEDVATDAIAYIQQLEAAQQKWIGVEERLPKNGQLCLAFGHKGNVHYMDIVVRGKTGIWEFCMMNAFKITHWMPLPQPPKEEEN